MSAVIIDGRRIAKAIRAEVKERVSALKQRGVTPGLRIVLVGDDPASLVYVAAKEKAGSEVGIDCQIVRLQAESALDDIGAVVEQCSSDPAVHGVIVQLPLPGRLDHHVVLDRLDPTKDVDGLTARSLGALVSGRNGFRPATPAGIIELLDRYGFSPARKRVVIVGRSELVGKPLANLLLLRGARGDATVTVCHTRTADLAAMTRTAEILVLAAGQPRLVTGEMVSEGVVVVDAGVNRIEDSLGRRLVGDADFESVVQRAAAITPVPGGVGPMTVAMLLLNTVIAAEQSVRKG